MTIAEIIRGSTLPALESEVLMAAILHCDRTWVIAHPEHALSRAEVQNIRQALRRRESGEPLRYITGQAPFFGREFIVNASVLIPRPATEFLITQTLRFLDEPHEEMIEADTNIAIVSRIIHRNVQPRVIVDIGTGSGCIAVTMALECPGIPIIATDISAAALHIADKNARRYRVVHRIHFRKGRNLAPIAHLRRPFLLVSNPPYIPMKRILEKSVRDFEPHGALFAGSDGMDVLTEMTYEALRHPQCCGIILECECQQAMRLREINPTV